MEEALNLSSDRLLDGGGGDTCQCFLGHFDRLSTTRITWTLDVPKDTFYTQVTCLLVKCKRAVGKQQQVPIYKETLVIPLARVTFIGSRWETDKWPVFVHVRRSHDLASNRK